MRANWEESARIHSAKLNFRRQFARRMKKVSNDSADQTSARPWPIQQSEIFYSTHDVMCTANRSVALQRADGARETFCFRIAQRVRKCIGIANL